ncbi:transmembrane protein 54-like [Carassius auratus]|uniref:Transmembrane protein 54-like n=1 Tax=Carassius auratus TaxID=7957 RepID=A0A6P6RJT5_CARAU|nr:transmembrane protein 54-like [Carassius auratus]
MSSLSLHPQGCCCGNLEEQKGLMKMGLSMVLVGHVNFLLGALVHGVVLRHFSLQRGPAMESAISNVIALATGLLMKTPRSAEPRYSPQSCHCQRDEERKRSIIRPPERHRPPLCSVSSCQYHQHPSASPFNCTVLERSSI